MLVPVDWCSRKSDGEYSDSEWWSIGEVSERIVSGASLRYDERPVTTTVQLVQDDTRSAPPPRRSRHGESFGLSRPDRQAL